MATAWEFQVLVNGEWTRQGPVCQIRDEAAEERSHQIQTGAACEGRDDSGNLLPNLPNRIMAVVSE